MWEVDCADLSCLGGGFHLGRGRCTIDHLWNEDQVGKASVDNVVGVALILLSAASDVPSSVPVLHSKE